MTTSALKFREILENLPDQNKVAILTQDNPDPDAMGSAFGISFLCRIFNAELQSVDIFYGGTISHPQNRTMVNLLGLPMRKMKLFRPEEYQLVILVDAASTGKKNLQSTDVHPDIIIDHHRDDPDGDYLMKDIRALGAASTIVTSYLREFALEKKQQEEAGPHPLAHIATGLLVGIKTDTQELTAPTVTPLDFQCYEYLLQLVDEKKLYQIINYTIPRYLYVLKAEAYRTMELEHSVVVSGLGIIPPSQRDAIPIIADELLRMEGIETVVAYAVIEDRIVASLRTTNDGVEVNSFCHQVFGEEFSGGKLGCGGASVPLGYFAPDDQSQTTREKVWEAVRALVSHRVFRAASSG
ncbi:MAG: bifunctional oligoribonuclease/PAP phosphatase NrnA [Myxococcota bacterium]